ncbi:DUF748 domain-containing protein, partial [Methylibium sp.]|uniref:DUF748 domain-containing protein n=1 Tax=Methylibium sp. TaxID=2067992 RepID=UPI0017C78164
MSRRTAFKVMAVGLLVIGLYALAGFVVLPALVERQAPAYAAERLEAELTVGDTSFNPFLLRFVAQDLRLAQQDQQEPMLTLERLAIDLDWSSLWSQGWTLSTLRLHSLHVRVEIDAEGRLDWAGLLRPREDQAQQSPPPVLHVGHVTVEAGRLALTDLRGPTPASVSLGKIEIEAFDISTQVGEERPEGRYGLSAVLPEEGSLRAQGSIVLQPALRSAGEVEVTSLNVAAVWPLLRVSLGLDLAPPASALSAKTRYAYSATPGAPALTLDAAELQLTGVALQPTGTSAPLLRLKTLTASGGRLDLAARELAFTEVGLDDGTLALEFDKEGRLDWQALSEPAAAPADEKRAQAADKRKPAQADAPPWRARIEALRVEGVALQAADRSRPIPLALDIAEISGRTGVALDFGPGPTRTRLSALDAQLEAPRLAAIGAAEPLLALDTLSIAGAALDTGERLIRIDEIAVRGGRAEVQLADGGSPGLLQALRSGEAQGETAPADGGRPDGGSEQQQADRKPASTPTGRSEPPPVGSDADADTPADWRYALDAFRAKGVTLALRHGGYEPAIEYTAELKDATLANIASAADTPMQLDAQLALAGGGSLAAKGAIAQSAESVDVELQLDRLPLLPLQPLLARHARLEMRSGLLSAKARLELRPGETNGFALRATGDATVDAVRIDEADSEERFLAWRSLQAEGVTLDTAPGRLSIREIEVQEPGAKLVIAEDRSVNLTQVIRDDPNAAARTAEAPAPEAVPFEVAIERIRFQSGVLDYTDLSLVLPFSTQVTSLDGSVLGITTARGERARVQAAGQIEPFGSARVNGSLLPFAPKEFLDLRVRMNNVAMPPLSPYTATFAGRTVAEGKLWLDLEYRIENGQLLGENKIRLDDFRLGERV